LTLPGIAVYVPAFDEDVASVVARSGASDGPSYIRLGRGELPPQVQAPAYAPWRRLAVGDGPVVIVVGPLAGSTLGVLPSLGDCPPELWVVSELPLSRTIPPDELTKQIARCGRVCVIEEHVAHGGIGAMLSQWLLEAGIGLLRYSHLCARGYPSERYGSQAYH